MWCPPETVLNEEKCTCECSIPKESCQFPRVFKPKICECMCPSKKTCYFPKFFNKTICDCDCWFKFCKKPQIKNLNNCECECPPNAKCPPHQVLNKDCICECRGHKKCSPKHYFNDNICQCQCRRVDSCGDNQYFDPTSCECKCKDILPCPNGRYYRPETCKCECTNKCNPNFKHNHDTCECIPASYSRCQSFLNKEECETANCEAGDCKWHQNNRCYCPCCTARFIYYSSYCNNYGLIGGKTNCHRNGCTWKPQCQIEAIEFR